MVETIKVEVDEALAKRFRKRAMEKYGYKKGAMKNALEDLMTKYASSSAKVDWSFLRGSLKEEYKGMSSVKLQESLWRQKFDTRRHKRLP